jgi:hypothetical protein
MTRLQHSSGLPSRPDAENNPVLQLCVTSNSSDNTGMVTHFGCCRQRCWWCGEAHSARLQFLWVVHITTVKDRQRCRRARQKHNDRNTATVLSGWPCDIGLGCSPIYMNAHLCGTILDLATCVDISSMARQTSPSIVNSSQATLLLTRQL